METSWKVGNYADGYVSSAEDIVVINNYFYTSIYSSFRVRNMVSISL